MTSLPSSSTLPDRPHPVFPYLFSPIRIRKTVIRNRVLITGHQPRLVTDGQINDRLYYYHVERAKGGVGLIVLEETRVARIPGRSYEGNTTLSNVDDSIIPGYVRLSEGVHAHGAKIIAQFLHPGRSVGIVCSKEEIRPGSGVRVATLEDMRQVATQFYEASARAKAGGLDGVELTTWSGSLFETCMSPGQNTRTDAYGGSFENRLRIVEEVLAAIREAVGDDLIVGIRIDAEAYVEGGLTADLTARIVATLADKKLIDYANVLGGGREPTGFRRGLWELSMYAPMGAQIGLAAFVKRQCDVPIFHAGRIKDVNLAETFLLHGYMDMVGMTRAHIADPYLLTKAYEGRQDEIITCVACNEGCIGQFEKNKPITCIQNPVTGREREWGELHPAIEKKRLVVVGGGATGLKVAVTAAQRGHSVTLLEKEQELGGMVRLASLVPSRQEFGDIIRNLTRRAERAGVAIRTGERATVESVLQENPDAVVVATGAVPAPNIPGAHLSYVYDSYEFLRETIQVGSGTKVILYDLVGDQVGCSIADMLARRGVSVEMVTSQKHFGWAVNMRNWGLLYYRMLKSGVILRPDMLLVCVEEDKVTLQHLYLPTPETRDDVGLVILHIGLEPNDGMYRELAAEGIEIHKIGYAAGLSDIHDALVGAEALAREL